MALLMSLDLTAPISLYFMNLKRSKLTLVVGPFALTTRTCLLTQAFDGVFGGLHWEHALRLVLIILASLVVISRSWSLEFSTPSTRRVAVKMGLFQRNEDPFVVINGFNAAEAKTPGDLHG